MKILGEFTAATGERVIVVGPDTRSAPAAEAIVYQARMMVDATGLDELRRLHQLRAESPAFRFVDLEAERERRRLRQREEMAKLVAELARGWWRSPPPVRDSPIPAPVAAKAKRAEARRRAFILAGWSVARGTTRIGATTWLEKRTHREKGRIG